LRDHAYQHINVEYMKNSKANQVENFEKLIVFCNTQSAVYKPSKVSIQLAALTTLLTQAQQSLKAADVARMQYENAINARQPLFASLPRLTSRMVDALRASGASAEVVQDAVTIKSRFKSGTKRLLTPAAETAPATEPVYRYGLSQLDFASKIENFERLVNRVSAEVLYKPNEADLKATALTALAQQVRTTNRNVINTYMAMKDTNRLLNVVLFNNSGLFENAQLVKAYVRSVFGKSSQQGKDVAQLEFVKR
jgi:hypothetical protein